MEILCDKHAKIKGKITVIGANQITYGLKEKLKKEYGNIDDPLNPLYIVYDIRELKSITMVPKQYFSEIGEYQLTFEIDSPYGNNQVSVEWSLAPNLYATIDSATGVVSVTRIGEETDDTGPNANVTVMVHLLDGTTITAFSNLNFWKRDCKIGDIVYHDGSFAPAKDHEAMVAANKIAVGVCFYIDPYDKSKRLMAALSDTVSGQFWGPSSANHHAVTLNDNPDLNVYAIDTITDYKNSWKITNYSAMRDDVSGDIDGWAVFLKENPLQTLGWVTVTEEFLDHKRGESIPYGKHDTDCVIEVRNIVLRDSAINLDIPEDRKSVV